MSSPAARPAASDQPRHFGEPLRVAFMGPAVWLDGCTPPEAVHGLTPERFVIAAAGDAERALAAIDAFQPHITVLFDPPSMPLDALRLAPGVTLGVRVAGIPPAASAPGLDGIDRLVSFAPAFTGAPVNA